MFWSLMWSQTPNILYFANFIENTGHDVISCPLGRGHLGNIDYVLLNTIIWQFSHFVDLDETDSF